MEWLANPTAPKVMHEAKGPLLALLARGWELAGLRMDTALAAHLLLPGQRSFDLRDLAARFAAIDLSEAAEDDGQLSLDADLDERREPRAREAVALLKVAAALRAELEARDALPLLDRVELPTLELLARMERSGIAADREYLTELEGQYAAGVREAEELSWQIAGRTFNLGSPKQLQEILFGERGLPKTKRIKTGYTTDAEALQSLYAQTADPLLESLLRFRDISKLRQTVAGPAADRRRRADPHHLQPARRSHGTPVQHRSEPAEHPDPDRGGSSHPGGLRRGHRL